MSWLIFFAKSLMRGLKKLSIILLFQFESSARRDRVGIFALTLPTTPGFNWSAGRAVVVRPPAAPGEMSLLLFALALLASPAAPLPNNIKIGEFQI